MSKITVELDTDTYTRASEMSIKNMQQLTAIANILPPLNLVGSDRCCALHIDKIAATISDVEIIALMIRKFVRAQIQQRHPSQQCFGLWFELDRLQKGARDIANHNMRDFM